MGCFAGEDEGDGDGEGVEQPIRKAKLQTAAPSKNVVLIVFSSLNRAPSVAAGGSSLMCLSSEKPASFDWQVASTVRQEASTAGTKKPALGGQGTL